MQALTCFNAFCNEITQSSSRLYKREVLRRHSTDTIIQQILHFVYNPYIVTGISSKKLRKVLPENMLANQKPFDLLGLLAYLKDNNTGRDVDIAVCQAMLSNIGELELELLLESIITKNLQLGVDAATINSCIPNLIPTFSVQLANKYFEKPEYVEGKRFALTPKIDGGRIIAIKKNNQVNFYTRAGQKYEGLIDLESEMLRCLPDNICLDGEITLLNRGTLSSKEQYKATMKIVRKDGIKHGVKMLVFDIMSADEFFAQSCETTYEDRRNHLYKLFAQHDLRYFDLLDILYIGSDTSEILKNLDTQVRAGEEGIMINICDAPYEFKRTNNLLKVKTFHTCDLRVIDMEQGTNKNSDRLGAFICEYKNKNFVKVGSGLTYEERLKFWTNRAALIGSIIEVGYFEETTNADGGLSLRFPTFKDIRPDKTEPSF